jgi:hypothetical protein
LIGQRSLTHQERKNLVEGALMLETELLTLTILLEVSHGSTKASDQVNLMVLTDYSGEQMSPFYYRCHV